MNDITFSQAAAQLIAGFEGFRASPYKDSVGIPTIGYGSTTYPDGTKVTMDDSDVSKQQGLDMLLYHLNTYELPDLQQHITVDLTQNQIDALGCLIYNIGDHGFDNSHVLSDINSGIMDSDLETRWCAWDKAAKQVIPGLLARRQKEYHYFETGSLS
jgi:lysozyme